MMRQRVIIYVRKSTEQEERQALSIQAQQTELYEFAAREQLTIVASFQEAKTAKSSGRTEFARMLHMLEKGEADAILSWHPDRLARNSIDGGQIIHFLDTGVLKNLYFPTLTFENNPNGKFMLSIAFSQSKFYVDNLSENVKRGIRQKLRRGEWSWYAPLGYRNNPETRNIESDPEYARFIQKAFALYATGDYTLPALKKALKDLGLRTRKGYPLSPACVQALLKNSLYCGMMKVNRELHQGAFEPLVSQDLFDKVQKEMGRRGKKHTQRKHEFLFSGFLQCSSCGCAITGEIQKGHKYYRCTKKKGPCTEKKYLREEKLLDQVKKIVEEVSLPDDWANPMLEQLKKEKFENLKEHQVAITELRDERVRIDGKLNDLLDLKLDGALDIEEYVAKKNTFVSQKAKLDEKISELERNPSSRLEPLEDMIIRSREAKKLVSNEDWRGCAAFVKLIGSNVLLKENVAWLEAKRGWRIIANRRAFDFGCLKMVFCSLY